MYPFGMVFPFGWVVKTLSLLKYFTTTVLFSAQQVSTQSLSPLENLKLFFAVIFQVSSSYFYK